MYELSLLDLSLQTEDPHFTTLVKTVVRAAHLATSLFAEGLQSYVLHIARHSRLFFQRRLLLTTKDLRVQSLHGCAMVNGHVQYRILATLASLFRSYSVYA